MNQGRALIAKRHAQFALVVLASAVAFRSPIGDLARLSFHNGLYSHIPFMPLLIACVLYAKRESLFSHVEYSPGTGLALAATGALFSAASFLFTRGLIADDRLSLLIISLLLVWTGAFTFAYGTHTLTKALYPVLLALFMIPLPGFLNDLLVSLLQRTSADCVYPVLRILGLPVWREGNVFHFPQMSIRIAEACSGLRSLVGLVITSVVAADLFLSRRWTRAIAIIAVLPITIAKNAMRIVVISLIAVYRGEEVFLGAFHKLVGFSIAALLMLWAVIALLRRLETKRLETKT